MNQETFKPTCSIRLLTLSETFLINEHQMNEIEKSMKTLINNFIRQLNKSTNMEIKANLDFLDNIVLTQEMSDQSKNYLTTYQADDNYFSIFIDSEEFDNLMNFNDTPGENDMKSLIAEKYLFDPIASQFSTYFKKNFEKKQRIYFDENCNLLFLITLSNGTVNSQIAIWAQHKFWLDFINTDYTAKNITLPDFTTKNAYAVLGEIDYPEEEIKNIKIGDIISFDNFYDQLAPYIINNRIFAQGEPVLINRKTLGLRITDFTDPEKYFPTNDDHNAPDNDHNKSQNNSQNNGHYIEENPYNLLVILDTNKETPETIRNIWEGTILEQGTPYIEDNFPVVYKNNVIALCRCKKAIRFGDSYINRDDYIQITKVLDKPVPFIGATK